MANLLSQIELLEWTDAQSRNVHDQLVRAFPELVAAIDKQIDGYSTPRLAGMHIARSKRMNGVLKEWVDRQSKEAIDRAIDSEMELLFVLEAGDGRPSAGHLSELLQGVAGLGVAGAASAAIPSVLTYATITTTSFFGLATATAISWPVFATGAVIVGTGILLGGTLTRNAAAKYRRHVREKLHRYAEMAVFGFGAVAPENSIAAKIHAAAVANTLNEIVGRTQTS